MSNAFVFADQHPPTIIILVWMVRNVCDHCGLCSRVFSHVTLSKLIIIFNFNIFAFIKGST